VRNYGNYASIIGKACYKGNKTTPQVAVFLDFTQWLQMSMGREQRLWPSKYKAPNPCLKHAWGQQQLIVSMWAFQEQTNFIQLSLVLLGASRDQDDTCERNSRSTSSAL